MYIQDLCGSLPQQSAKLAAPSQNDLWGRAARFTAEEEDSEQVSKHVHVVCCRCNLWHG